MRPFMGFAMAGLPRGGVLAVPRGCGVGADDLRVVMLSDLKILDPIWTTAYIVRDHGYMVYDTLLAMDASSRSSRRWPTAGR